jgi:hypothetical protein
LDEGVNDKLLSDDVPLDEQKSVIAAFLEEVLKAG